MTEIAEHQNIWFPGIYSGREGDYARSAIEFSRPELVKLVQTRVNEDGEWSIANGHVGNNEDKMRMMMSWAAEEKNILQCFDSNAGDNPTVDWICRDLANASKWIGGGGARD